MELNEPLIDLTKENILKHVSILDIYSRYMDKPIFDTSFSSPFRTDNNPSFIIRKKTGYFRDYATGEYGDCFTFVKKLYNIDYNEALSQIALDLNISKSFNMPSLSNVRKLKKVKVENFSKRSSISGNFVLKIKKRKWLKKDIDYWNEYGVDVTNPKWRIVPISYFFLNGTPFRAEEYAYAFIEMKDNKVTFKVYQPFSNYKKWINNNNFSIWELWHLLPSTGDILIITSSRKDAAAIIQNTGIPATSLQAESIIPKKNVISDLNKRFKTIYLLYDNDQGKEKNWGQENALKLLKLYPFLNNIVIPDELKSKDFSDLYYNHGKEKSILTLNNLL